MGTLSQTAQNAADKVPPSFIDWLLSLQPWQWFLLVLAIAIASWLSIKFVRSLFYCALYVAIAAATLYGIYKAYLYFAY